MEGHILATNLDLVYVDFIYHIYIEGGEKEKENHQSERNKKTMRIRR